jgi:hypothetical protein
MWTTLRSDNPYEAPLPDKQGVLTLTHDGNSAVISIAGRDRATLEQVGTIANPGGHGFISSSTVNARYGVIVFSPRPDAEAAMYDWQIYLWNRSTGDFHRIAQIPIGPDGSPLADGGWIEPQLTDRYVTWLQGDPEVKDASASSLVQYSLATGRIRTLYRGWVTKFIQYGHTVLYVGLDAQALAARAHGGTAARYVSLTQQAVDADTGPPATSPSGLNFARDANTVVTNGDVIVWTTGGAIRIWRPSWQTTLTLVPDQFSWPTGARLGAAGGTEPQLYGHFLVWASQGVFVLDLRTNTFATLARTNSSVDLSGPMLSIEADTTGQSPNTTTLTVLNLAGLPSLPACRQ